jgi:hypothetical protein
MRQVKKNNLIHIEGSDWIANAFKSSPFSKSETRFVKAIEVDQMKILGRQGRPG